MEAVDHVLPLKRQIAADWPAAVVRLPTATTPPWLSRAAAVTTATPASGGPEPADAAGLPDATADAFGVVVAAGEPEAVESVGVATAIVAPGDPMLAAPANESGLASAAHSLPSAELKTAVPFAPLTKARN